MNTRTRRNGLAAMATLLILSTAFTACRRDADRDTTADTDRESRVTDVTLGRSVDANNRVSDRTTDFNARDTIYAAIDTDNQGAGGTLAARWTFEDGQVVDESSRSIAAGGNVTTFHIVNPNGWPSGRYRVEILVNGQVTRTEEFRVN